MRAYWRTYTYAGPTSQQYLDLHGNKRMYTFQRGGVIQGTSTSAIIRQVNTILSSAMNEAQLLRSSRPVLPPHLCMEWLQRNNVPHKDVKADTPVACWVPLQERATCAWTACPLKTSGKA